MALSTALVSLSVLILIISVPADSRSYRSNICKMVSNKPLCCPGWTLDSTNLHCSIPICPVECESNGGRCIRPDTCLCPGGYVAYSCYVANNRNSRNRCRIRCLNGGTCNYDRCECRPGFTGDRCQIASCPRNCSGQGKCQSDGVCKCQDGFFGKDCSEQLKGPCFQKIKRGLCQGKVKGTMMTMQVCCSSLGVAWGEPCKQCARARCPRGFEWSQATSKCEDVDECREIINVCNGGTCRNERGKFTCVCPPGTKFDQKKMECRRKTNICARKPRICGEGLCVSGPMGSSYRCKCFAGYRLSTDGTRCVSQAAFLTFNMCHYNRGYLCSNGECVPDGRSYKCRCNIGYQASDDERSCKKVVDFCKLYGSRVCANGVCRTLPNNNYRCQCNLGYETSTDQKSCISTCDRYGGSLCPNGRCVPASVGGYKCKCNRGYYQSLNQKSCVKDTSVSRTVCDYYTLCSNGRCIATEKSYRCQCNDGFERSPDGKSCRERRRKRRDHVCDLFADYYCPNGKCIRMGKNYRCECNAGYILIDGQCRRRSRGSKSKKDVNKRGKGDRKSSSSYCAKYPHLCENGKCVSTSNYFYCECDQGYKAVDDRRRCRKQEKTPKRLTTGFYDFCQHYSSECRGGTCHNEPTTFWCSCVDGYKWVPSRLQCVKEKPQQLVSDQWASAQRQKQQYAWQNIYSACEKMGRDVCRKGYCVDKGSSYECRCYSGYQATEHKKRCVDINECDLRPNSCWQGKCVNTPGSYSCQCIVGFKLSHVNEEPICVDRDECMEANPCINGVCRNTWGSYKCVCLQGYVNDETGQQCLPANSVRGKSEETKETEGSSKNGSKESWTDRAMSDSPVYVSNCSHCQYDCRWMSNGNYICECPPGLSTLGNSDLCVEENSVEQYTFEINMDEPERRRRKRSVPDHVAMAHLMGRIVLRKGVDVDHFSNSLVSRYRESHFYKVIRLGDLRSNSTHTIIDVVFT